MTVLLALLPQVACGNGNDEPVTPQQPEQPESPSGGDANEDTPDTPSPGDNSRYLVVYASRSGNTERVAKEICTQLNGDLLEVEPIRQGNYPPIKTSVEDFDKYDMIFVGYPIWYSSMATPMQTFLHNHASKLAGKTLALFATSGSSGISTSVNEARALCPEAEFTQTLLLTSSSLPQMESRVASWLEQLNVNIDNNPEDMNTKTLKLTVGNKTFTATLADNSSVEALKERLAQDPLTISMTDYGDMEKVGALGFSLPRNDTSITTGPGDLILYQGSSLVIYYDSFNIRIYRVKHTLLCRSHIIQIVLVSRIISNSYICTI